MDDIDNHKIGKRLATLANDEKVLARAQTVLEQSRRALGFAKRRSRGERLIHIGGLFVIAGLMVTDLNVVLGALIQAKSLEGDKARCRAWTQGGQQAFARWQAAGRNPTRPDPRTSDPRESPIAVQNRLTRKLIIRGAVVEKARMDGWQAATILGILLVIARNVGDAARVASWKLGGAAFRAASRPPLHPHIVVVFKGRIPRPIAAQLRSLELELKRKNRWFIGRADPAAAYAIAERAGGEVHVLKPGKRLPW
jgi:hypothetical protein